MSELIIYEQPNEALGKDDFTVSVREPGGVWQSLFVFEAKVDMHQVRSTSMVYFDMDGTVEVSVHCKKQQIEQAVIRPLASQISFQIEENTLLFTLSTCVSFPLKSMENVLVTCIFLPTPWRQPLLDMTMIM